MNAARNHPPPPPSRARQSGPPPSRRGRVRPPTDTPILLWKHAPNYATNHPSADSLGRAMSRLISRNQAWMKPVGLEEQFARLNRLFTVSSRSLRFPVRSGGEGPTAKNERTNPTRVALTQQVARFRRRNVGADGGKLIKTNPSLPYWQTLSMDLLCKSKERTQRRHIGSLPLKIREERSRTSKSVLGMMSPSNIRPATNACTGLPAGNVENSRQRGMQSFRSYLTSALRCTRTPAPRDPERPQKTLPTTEKSRPYLDHPHRPSPGGSLSVVMPVAPGIVGDRGSSGQGGQVSRPPFARGLDHSGFGDVA